MLIIGSLFYLILRIFDLGGNFYSFSWNTSALRARDFERSIGVARAELLWRLHVARVVAIDQPQIAAASWYRRWIDTDVQLQYAAFAICRVRRTAAARSDVLGRRQRTFSASLAGAVTSWFLHQRQLRSQSRTQPSIGTSSIIYTCEDYVFQQEFLKQKSLEKSIGYITYQIRWNSLVFLCQLSSYRRI